MAIKFQYQEKNAITKIQYSPLLTVYRLQFTAYCLLFTAYCNYVPEPENMIATVFSMIFRSSLSDIFSI